MKQAVANPLRSATWWFTRPTEPKILNAALPILAHHWLFSQRCQNHTKAYCPLEIRRSPATLLLIPTCKSSNLKNIDVWISRRVCGQTFNDQPQLCCEWAVNYVRALRGQGAEPTGRKLRSCPLTQHKITLHHTENEFSLLSIWPHYSRQRKEKNSLSPRIVSFLCMTACMGTVLLLISAMALISPLPYLLPPQEGWGEGAAAALRGHVSNK